MVSGSASVASTETGRRITADLDAELAALTPDQLDPLFGGTSTLDVDVTIDGGVARIETARVVSSLADITASGTLDLAGPDTDATLTARFGPADGSPLRIEETGAGPLVLDDVALDARITGPIGRPQFRLDIGGEALEVSGLKLDDFSLGLEGEGAVPSPASPLEVAVRAQGRLEAAERLGIPGAAQGDIVLDTRVSLTSFDDIAIQALDLATGELNLQAQGSVSPQTAGFDLTFDLDARSPDTGYAIADGLLAGDVAASGRALRDPETQTLLFDGVSLTSETLALSLSGQGNAQTIDVDAQVTLKDLSALSPQAEGSVSARATLSGTRAAPVLDLDATGQDVVLAGQAFTRPQLTVDAVLDAQAPSGDLAFTGALGGEPIDVTARIATGEDGVRRLTGLDARVASASLTGELALPREGAPTGTLAFAAPDLSDIAPLLLTELAGALDAEIALGPDETASVTLQGRDIAAAGATVGTVSADLTVETWLSQPTPQGQASIRDLAVGGLAIPTLDLTARQTGENAFATTLTAEAEGVDVSAEANVLFSDEGTRIELSALQLDGQGLDTELAGPAALVLGQDATRIEEAVLLLGGGRVSVEGLLSPRLDLQLGLADVSLAIADGFAPDLALDGVVNGAASVTGDPADPEAVFEVVVSDVTAAPLTNLNAPPLTLDTSGRYAAGRIDAEARVTGPNGAAIDLTSETLDVDGLLARVTVLGEPATAEWTAQVTADAIETAGVRAASLDIALDGQGLTISPETPILLDLDGSADLSGEALPPVLTGRLALDAAASIPSLDNILVQRARASVGETSLTLSGRVNATTPAFDLTVDGDANSPQTGIAALDGLLRGDVDLSGGLQGNVAADTYTLANLQLTAPALDIALTGTIAPQTVDVDAEATLRDLSALSAQAAGAVTLTANLSGARTAPVLNLDASGDDVVLAGQAFTRPNLTVDATLDPQAPSGDLAFTGRLGDQPVDVSARIETDADGVRRLTDLDARIASARLTGELALPREGAPTGTLALDAPDLSEIGPLVLTELAGALEAEVDLGAGRDGDRVPRGPEHRGRRRDARQRLGRRDGRGLGSASRRHRARPRSATSPSRVSRSRPSTSRPARPARTPSRRC